MTEVHKIDAIKRSTTKQMTVGQVTQPLSQVKTLNSKDSVYQAFQELIKSDSSFLPVTDNKGKSKTPKITGIIRKENIMNALVWNLKFGANFEDSKTAKTRAKTSKKSKTKASKKKSKTKTKTNPKSKNKETKRKKK